MSQSLIAKFLFCTTILIAGHVVGFSQGSAPQRGFYAGGSYVMSDIETINTNLFQGNLMLNFPLAKLPPGRGGLTAGIYLRYDSKLYDSHLEYYPDYDYGTPPDPMMVTRNILWASDQGGWNYGMGYELQLINRLDGYYETPAYPDMDAKYKWKVRMVFPDGSVHEFLPRGFGAQAQGDGYYDYRPDGWQTVWTGSPYWYTTEIPGLSGATHYYTFDGSYLRLDVEHDSNGNWWDNPWTLTFPNGTKVTQTPTQPQRITDRNGNYIELVTVTLNGHPSSALRDQENRQIILEPTGTCDVIHNVGFNGADLSYHVYWKLLQVGGKEYKTVDPLIGPNPNGYPSTLGTLHAISEIDLPTQSGGLKYVFGYNAQDYGSVPWGTPSVGLGELNSIQLQGPASDVQYTVQYQYQLDNQYGPSDEFRWDYLLKNAVAKKTLTYDEKNDGATSPVTEVTTYGTDTVIMPDATRVYNSSDPQRVYWTQNPDGSLVEKVWASNTPQGFPTAWQVDPITGINAYDPSRANGFVKWEFTSIKDSNGTYVKTAIKEFAQDKNGNTTKVTEYDWVPYGDVPRTQGWPTGVPGSAVKKRETTNTLARSTPDSTDTSSNGTDSYWNYTAPNLRNAISSTEIGNGTTTLSRAEFSYDNSGTTGNLTEQKMWDSIKGSLTRPLSSGNSISTSNQYDGYGNVTVSTDARGSQTTITYGAINGYSGLFPTQVVNASNFPSIARTTTSEYDFSSGLAIRTRDVDNNVATFTDYDAFGRPTLVKTAENTAKERRTVTQYSDIDRRVVVKSDLTSVGDGKLVTIQHYDPLGRVRLTRQLEDSATESATDETTGIKTQTRYRIYNPCTPYDSECLSTNANVIGRYTLVSSPYRASTSAGATSEQSMGWTVSRSDRTGRTVEVKTYGGSSLPYPWSSSTVNTGTVTTSYDANFTTVTDQAGKLRRSMVDGLGRLTRMDEPTSGNALGSTAAPNQPTIYTYDALGNLLTVDQNTSIQAARSFTYSSLSRLTSAFNPESGTVNYKYDENGNLIVKTDARLASVHYEYDKLNRITRRWYNGGALVTDTTNGTPALPSGVGATAEVRFSYSTLPTGAPSFSVGTAVGRLVAQTYGSGTEGDYFAYDVLGQPIVKIQRTGNVDYQVSAVYGQSGALTSLTYPSGRSITNSLDTAGRLSSVSGSLGDSNNRTYSTGILYASTGALVKEQFGTATPIYNKLFYNSRGQLAEIRESTSYTGPSDTSWNRGAIISHYSDQCWGMCSGSSMSDNNGNLQKQEVYIPNDDQVSSYVMRWQQYDYDSLNRLNWVREIKDGTEQWKQQFTYDRWGNRTINTGVTCGIGINNQAFTVDTSNNRLGVPNGQSGTMSYDAAGNLTNDTYTGAGNRTYDGENKITSAWGGNNQAQLYAYDGSGQRIKRTVDGVETWQVYGFGGELIAEYAASGAAVSPKKEYGYRNGQLLVTAATANAPEDVVWTNVIGATASGNTLTKTAATAWGNAGASSTRSIVSGDGYVEFKVTTANTGMVGLSHADANQDYTSMEFALLPNSDGNLYVFESGVNRGVVSTFTTADVFRVAVEGGVVKYRKNGTLLYISTVSPTYPLLVDAGLYVSGASHTNVVLSGNLSGTTTENVTWTNVVGATASGNALTKTAATAWGNAGASSTRSIVSGDGYVEFKVTAANTGMVGLSHTDANQDYTSMEFALLPNSDGNLYVFESGVNRGVVSSFTTADVFRVAVEGGVLKYRKNGTLLYTSTVAPTYPLLVDAGLYINGASHTNVVLSGNLTGGASNGLEFNWLVTDQLGTPRMVFDETGDLNNVKRHDYLPFGEELFAPVSGRTPGQGYTIGDGVRQQFTSKERDTQTGLDYSEARYYSSVQGRFTGVDPTLMSAKSAQPQSWNRYSYCISNPLKWIDPSGLSWFYEDHEENGHKVRSFSWYENDEDAPSNLTIYTEPLFYGGPDSLGGERIWLGPSGEYSKLTEDQYDEAALRYAETGDVGFMKWWQVGLLQALMLPNTGPHDGEGISEEEEEQVPLFSQKTASERFQEPEPGEPPSPVAGMTIGEVSAGLRSGSLNPSQLPLEVVNRNGQLLSLNTRSLLALRRAGISPSQYVLRDLTGNAQAEEALTQRLLHNKMTSGSDVLRVTGVASNASSIK